MVIAPNLQNSHSPHAANQSEIIPPLICTINSKHIEIIDFWYIRYYFCKQLLILQKEWQNKLVR